MPKPHASLSVHRHAHSYAQVVTTYAHEIHQMPSPAGVPSEVVDWQLYIVQVREGCDTFQDAPCPCLPFFHASRPVPKQRTVMEAWETPLPT